MLVSNNSLLNILLPNDNKVLKDVLKEADLKTLNNIKNNNSVNDILKNLFTNLSTENQSKTNIENILKNSSIFKDLGSLTNSLSSLIKQIESNSNLAKYKPMLEAFFKDISKMDNKSLKESIINSGVFLESKVLDEIKSNSNLPKNIETILNQLKTLLKNISTLESKKIESLIDKLLQNNHSKSSPLSSTINNIPKSINLQNQLDLKSLVPMLQNLSKGIETKELATINNLTNSLKNISNDGQLLESKISNNKLQENDNKLLENKTKINSNIKENLLLLKNELILSKNVPNSQNLLIQINKLLQINDIFSKSTSQIEPKNLINQLINLNEIKTASSENLKIENLLSKLNNLNQNISDLENKVQLNQNVKGEKNQLTQDIKQNLENLKTELINIKSIDTKIINQIIDKLLNIQNLFSKIELPIDLKKFQQIMLNQTTNINNFQSNISSNVNNLILNLKESITNFSANKNNLILQNSIIKTIDKLENIINNFQINVPLLNDITKSDNPLRNDMKTILLRMQEELINKTDPKSIDNLKQIDKMLMQVEYYQLLSITSNTNSVYIPFLWDMLEEGYLSMKKLDKEKFYCEINLSLKEFGQTQLLLSLYDKNKIDLTIYASQNSFKKLLKENSLKLKQALNSVDLIPVNFKIIDLKKENEEDKEIKKVNSFKQDIDIGFGINIKA